MSDLSDVQFLSIKSYSDHPEVYKMADLIVDSYVASKKRVHRKKYVLAARKLVASLWCHPSDWFRFSTKPAYYSTEKKQVFLTNKILTLFKHMRGMEPELFRLVYKAIPPGISNTGRGMAAIYCRSSYFRKTLEMLRDEDIIIDPELERVTLKNDDDIFIPIPRSEREKPWFDITVKTLKNHSEILSKSKIRGIDGTLIKQHDISYFRRFKGSLEATGRLYAPFINWSKEERLGVTFDGIPAMAIDISSLNPVLLLRLKKGIEAEPPGLFTGKKDPYYIPFWDHLPRAVHKALINLLFNCKTEEQMVKGLGSTHWWTDDDGRVRTETYKGKKKRKGQPVFEGKSKEIRQYIDSFKSGHPFLSDSIGTGVGNLLQWIDSELMLFILRAANEKCIPVLPVHDEMVFPENQKGFMLAAVIAAFWVVLGEAGEFGTLQVKVKRLISGKVQDEQISLELSRYATGFRDD